MQSQCLRVHFIRVPDYLAVLIKISDSFLHLALETDKCKFSVQIGSLWDHVIQPLMLQIEKLRAQDVNDLDKAHKNNLKIEGELAAGFLVS